MELIMWLVFTDGSWHNNNKQIGIGLAVFKAVHCEQNSFAPVITELFYLSRYTTFSNINGVHEFLACQQAISLVEELNTVKQDKTIIVNDNTEIIKMFSTKHISTNFSQRLDCATINQKILYNSMNIEFRQLSRNSYGMKLADMLSKNSTNFLLNPVYHQQFSSLTTKMIDMRYDVCPLTESLFVKEKEIGKKRNEWFNGISSHKTLTHYLLSL
jgi:ribonuclease HI